MHGTEQYELVMNKQSSSDDKEFKNTFDRAPSDLTLNDLDDRHFFGKDRLSSVPTQRSNKSKINLFRKQDETQSHTRLVRFSFIRDWWLELVGVVFIIGALIAIFATAYSYQDHPLPAWPHWISINSLIAIYVVVLKASILLILAQGLSHLKWTWFTKSRPLNDLARYDNASRGPLGSFGLLWALRGRDLVSSIGAMIIIAAVVLDPMAQQIIRYYSRPIIQPGVNATLLRTNAYMETGLHVGAGISTIPVGLQSAINGGVFVPGANIVRPDCLTGNCTFTDAFHTVGFTASCTDVSDELTFANVSLTYDVTLTKADPNNPNNFIPQVVSQNATVLNATLPSGLSTSYSVTAYSVTSYMAMAYNSSTSEFEIILGPRTNSPSPQDNFCSGPLDSSKSSSDWNCRGYGAARCTLSPAVFAITSQVRSGNLQENITLQTTNFSAVGVVPSAIDIACLDTAQKTALEKAGYVLPKEGAPQWLPYNVSLSTDVNNTLIYESSAQNASDTTKKIAPPRCIYQYSGISTNSINIFLADYLSGRIVPMGSQWTGSSVAQQFYNSSGITFSTVSSMFLNISAAMTTHVRENGWANNSAPALGEVWHSETCIRVRWALFAFPVVLAVLTLVFFVSMVLETRSAQQGVHHDFKSSPLALLFHGLDEPVQKRLEKLHLGESNEVEELKNQAKGMFVRLRPTNKGWRFVTTSDEHDERNEL